MHAVQIVNVGGKPGRSLGVLPNATTLLTLGTAMSLNAARALAHGIGSEGGLVTIGISAASVQSLYVFDEVTLKWGTGGATTGRYQLAFAGRGQDEFKIPVDQLFYIVSDTGSITCTTSARRVIDRYPVN